MMKKSVIYCASLLMLVSGCTKKEYHQYDLKSDLNLKVLSYSEFGQQVNDKANFEVLVEGSVPEIRVVTDTGGSGIIKELPLGTYNLVFSKSGYGTKKEYVRFMGNEKEFPVTIPVAQKSSTKITDYTLDLNSRILKVSGNVSHNFPLILFPYDWPRLRIFISDKADVSNTNFIKTTSIVTDMTNPAFFSTSLDLNFRLFPSGSTVYVIVYGVAWSNAAYSDPESDVYIDQSIGEPSEVKSIVVP